MVILEDSQGFQSGMIGILKISSMKIFNVALTNKVSY